MQERLGRPHYAGESFFVGAMMIVLAKGLMGYAFMQDFIVGNYSINVKHGR